MNWQDYIVFIIVTGAAVYVGKSFIRQIGAGLKANARACSGCSACDEPPSPNSEKLVQISTDMLKQS